MRGLNLFMGMYGYIFGLCNMSKYILVNWWFHNVERQIVHVNSKFSNTCKLSRNGEECDNMVNDF